MMGIALIGLSSLVLGYSLAKIRQVDEQTHIIYRDGTGGKDTSWSVYVEATDDPAVYRGVYIRQGGVEYSAEGHGISNTLEALAEEIKHQ